MKLVNNFESSDTEITPGKFTCIDPFENNAIFGNTCKFITTPGLYIGSVSTNILIIEQPLNSGNYIVIFIGTGLAHFSLTNGKMIQKFEGKIERRQVWISLEPGSAKDIEYGDKAPGFKLKAVNMAFGDSPSLFLEREILIFCNYNSQIPSQRNTGLYSYCLKPGPQVDANPYYIIYVNTFKELSFYVKRKSVYLNIKTNQAYGHRVYENVSDYELEKDELEFLIGNFVYGEKLSDIGEFIPLWVEGKGNTFAGKIFPNTLISISSVSQEYWIYLDNYRGNQTNYNLCLNWLLIIKPRLLCVEVNSSDISSGQLAPIPQLSYLGFIDGENESNIKGFVEPIFSTIYHPSTNNLPGKYPWLLEKEGKSHNYVFSYETVSFNVI